MTLLLLTKEADIPPPPFSCSVRWPSARLLSYLITGAPMPSDDVSVQVAEVDSFSRSRDQSPQPPSTPQKTFDKSTASDYIELFDLFHVEVENLFSLIDVNEMPRLQRHSQPLYEKETGERHRGEAETDGTAVLLNLNRKVMKLDL